MSNGTCSHQNCDLAMEHDMPTEGTELVEDLQDEGKVIFHFNIPKHISESFDTQQLFAYSNDNKEKT